MCYLQFVLSTLVMVIFLPNNNQPASWLVNGFTLTSSSPFNLLPIINNQSVFASEQLLKIVLPRQPRSVRIDSDNQNFNQVLNREKGEERESRILLNNSHHHVHTRPHRKSKVFQSTFRNQTIARQLAEMLLQGDHFTRKRLMNRLKQHNESATTELSEMISARQIDSGSLGSNTGKDIVSAVLLSNFIGLNLGVVMSMIMGGNKYRYCRKRSGTKSNSGNDDDGKDNNTNDNDDDNKDNNNDIPEESSRLSLESRSKRDLSSKSNQNWLDVDRQFHRPTVDDEDLKRVDFEKENDEEDRNSVNFVSRRLESDQDQLSGTETKEEEKNRKLDDFPEMKEKPTGKKFQTRRPALPKPRSQIDLEDEEEEEEEEEQKEKEPRTTPTFKVHMDDHLTSTLMPDNSELEREDEEMLDSRFFRPPNPTDKIRWIDNSTPKPQSKRLPQFSSSSNTKHEARALDDATDLVDDLESEHFEDSSLLAGRGQGPRRRRGRRGRSRRRNRRRNWTRIPNQRNQYVRRRGRRRRRPSRQQNIRCK